MSKTLIERLWDKDLTLWSQVKTVQGDISNRLGWLDAPAFFTDKIQTIKSFAQKTTHTNVVLLGMGGSSLASEVFLQSINPADLQRKFHVLDTTDAQTICNLAQTLPLDSTLFIIASKSGTTLEVKSLFQYFWELVPNPSQYIAITDDQTPLHDLALELKFAKVWINPQTIGGRFSALSYFGLVPFALMGGDIDKLWQKLHASLPVLLSEDSPALSLAHQLYQSHTQGTHKLTLQATRATHALPIWVEQLIAESTGKQELGFLPIIQDHGLVPPQQSYVHVFGFADELDEDMTVHSVSVFEDVEDIGSEFFMWQMTTALLGAMMNINPFDQPHVNTTKTNTANYLTRSNPEKSIQEKLASATSSTSDLDLFIDNIDPTTHTVCILSYLPETEETTNKLLSLKHRIKKKCDSVTINIGPRYLHSTGQFHKGGKDIARYVILTKNQPAPIVPGEIYDFNTLKQAQAMGDYEALQKASRTVILLHTA